MKTQSKSLIAIAAATFVCVSALAVAHEADRITPEGFVPTPLTHSAGASELCPPSACTIVFKTEKGGPPSTVVDVD